MDSMTIGFIAAAVLAFVILLCSIRKNGDSIRSVEERLSVLTAEGRNANAAASPISPDEIPLEVVAAISAAVACIYPGAQIRSLRRAPEKPRSVWQTAGLLENTRPF